jgi:hypothetical protein
MPKRPSIHRAPQDESQLAKSIVDELTIDFDEAPPEKPEKNPAAVALGRLGGLKGGEARAAKLSAKRRKEIAKKAAETRWENQKGKSV